MQILLVISAASILLSGCGARGDSAGDGSNSVGGENFAQRLSYRPTPRSCAVTDLNDWVHRSLLDYYLFYDQVDRTVDTSRYDSPEELMRELRVAPNDRYSYVTDEAAYSAFFDAGETFGFGWNFARDANDALLFSLIEVESPLARAGVQRGEELVAIDGLSIDDFSDLPVATRQDMLGRGDQITSLDLTVKGLNGVSRTVSVTKATYTLKTVLDATVVVENGVSVGYLHFYQFIDNSSEELREAFAIFKSAGISELVLDLRFNGGGRIAIANELASYIIGDNHSQDVFTTFAFNDKYGNDNESVNFLPLSQALTLNRVFVLQSDNTCSASELVVNSLRPFMEVITVGSTSCGKPYATTPNTACGKVSNALEIELLNAAGAGGYFDGINADCPVAEDLSVALGDKSEPLLATALRYISRGNCNFMARQSRQRGTTLTSEFKSEWKGGNTL